VTLLRGAPLLDRVPLVGLYIAEAHANDEWPVSSTRYTIDGAPICVNQPRTLEDRARLAARFVTEYRWIWPMIVDGMEVEAGEGMTIAEGPCLGTLLSSWPMRAYLLHKNQVVLCSSPLGADVGLGQFLEEVEAIVQQENGRPTSVAKWADGTPSEAKVS
jgi:hypothetical protein